MAMRTMTHHGRGKGRAGHTFGSKHDDRNFDVEKANNIDPELTPGNHYWSLYEGYTFEEAEVKFYEENFSEQLQETNDKYIANGHPERCKDMAAWKKIRQHAPEESLFQIGDKHNTGIHVDSLTLFKCFNLFIAEANKWNREHGNPFTVLNHSLHVDEPSCPPHIHTRKAWHYKAEDGTLRVGQERALEMAGVELPHPDKPLGRYNNRKMTYDAMMRQKWLDILESYNIEVEREPLPDGKGKKSKTREEHIREKYDAMKREAEAAQLRAKELEEQNALLQRQNTALANQLATGREELEEICQIKNMAERDQLAADAMGQIDTLQSAFDVVDDFCDAAEQELEYGGLNLKNLVQNFIFDWHRVREHIGEVVNSIKEKIRNIGIFELLKKVRPENQIAGKLRESLDSTLAGVSKTAARMKNIPGVQQELDGDLKDF